MDELKPRKLWEAVTELGDMAMHQSSKRRLSAETLTIAITAINEKAERNCRPAPENKVRFENGHIYEAGENVESIADICEVLIKGADLRKLMAAPENKPLTLDQLRQMDGEPVWVCGMPGHKIKWAPGWRIIDGNRVAHRRWNDTSMLLYFADYGRTWLAYARKPGQEDSK